MNKPIKKINYILYILACITICIFIISIFIYDRATDTRQQQSPFTIAEWKDYQKTFYKKKTVLSGTISVNNSVDNILAFYSVHQNVKVFVDSKLIYEYPVSNNNPLSDSPGYCWNFIVLPHNTNNIEIVFTSPYTPYLKNIPTFYIGNNF